MSLLVDSTQYAFFCCSLYVYEVKIVAILCCNYLYVFVGVCIIEKYNYYYYKNNGFINRVI